MADRLPILLLVKNYISDLSYFDDWTDSLTHHPDFDTEVVDIASREGRNRAADRVKEAHFIVCLHSTNGDGVDELNQLLPSLQSRKGQLAVFVGNELNLPLAPMKSKLSFLRNAAADLILTQFMQETGTWFYEPVSSARVVSLPHALNEKVFYPGKAQAQRLRDIGARSHRYSVHVGDVERVTFFERFGELARRRGLNEDIELGGHRFGRTEWSQFLRESRTTLATEAGSLYTQRDDVICDQIQALLRDRSDGQIVVRQDSVFLRIVPKLMPKRMRQLIRGAAGGFVRLDHELSTGLTTDEMAEIQRKFFTAENRAPKYTKVISSRHFDAIGSKTVQIMPTGSYNEILRGDEHFVAVSKDFGNMHDVIERISDLQFCQRMADQTYEYVMAEHRYTHRCARLDAELRSLSSRAG